MGINQKIGCVVAGAMFAAGVALAFTGKVEGKAFLDFMQWFGPSMTGVILGGSAIVKGTGAIGEALAARKK